MFKVRSKIAYEQKAIDVVESRKKIQAEKKFGKQVQKARLAEKAKEKTSAKESIKKWKEKRADQDDDNGVMGKPQKNTGNKARGAQKNAKRAAKDARYGNGGKKRGSKRNGKESEKDAMNAFYGKGKTKGKGGKGKGKGGGKG